MSRPHQHLDVGQDRALATDLYQLTMMFAYLRADMDANVTFELFVRRLPRNRRFLVAAGIEQVLAFLWDIHFSADAIDYLRSLPTFQNAGDPKSLDEFFARLEAFRFRGTVRAVPEGTLFFPDEPVLQVSGSLFESQLIETYLLSTFNYQTLVASKAARVRLAAGNRVLADFGSRRAHGPGAALAAARAAYVGGFDATSNVVAGLHLGIPVVGTAAHAYTMAFDKEEDAFAHYLDTFPKSTLLIDTYDTARGACRAAKHGKNLGGVRLDSGDLGAHAKDVRKTLDDAGCGHARIVASSDLNEYKVAALVADGAPIDSFGVGTELVTSRDDPALSGVYKLVEKRVGGRRIPTMKFSSSKSSYPGEKDVYRAVNAQGAPVAGILCQRGEAPPTQDGWASITPLLTTMIQDGEFVVEPEPISAVRQRTLDGLSRLGDQLRGLEGEHEPIPLVVSEATREKMKQCEERFDVESTTL